MNTELQNRLQTLEWNAANGVYNVQVALETLGELNAAADKWVYELASRRRESDRHCAALVEFKRSHTIPIVTP